MLKKRFLGALLIVPLVLLAGCLVPEERPEEPEAPVVPQEPTPLVTTVSSEVVQGLELELSLPTVSYRPGEILQASLSLINTTPDAIPFETRTSQLFDLIIRGPERERRWSEDMMFLQVVTPHRIPAGERLSDVLSWEIDLSPGDFYLTGLTVPFELNGERIRLETTTLKITVE